MSTNEFECPRCVELRERLATALAERDDAQKEARYWYYVVRNSLACSEPADEDIQRKPYLDFDKYDDPEVVEVSGDDSLPSCKPPLESALEYGKRAYAEALSHLPMMIEYPPK